MVVNKKYIAGVYVKIVIENYIMKNMKEIDVILMEYLKNVNLK